MTTLHENAEYIKSLPVPTNGYTASLTDGTRSYPVRAATIARLSQIVVKLQEHFILDVEAVHSF